MDVPIFLLKKTFFLLGKFSETKKQNIFQKSEKHQNLEKIKFSRKYLIFGKNKFSLENFKKHQISPISWDSPIIYLQNHTNLG